MTRPDMWATVAEDGQQPHEYTPDVIGHCWLAMFAPDALVALYHLHAHNSVTCEIHAQVFPEYRAEYSEGTGLAALRWIYENTRYEKVVCWVPEIYTNVRSFAESFGFQLEGTNRKSYRKNGKLLDMWLLGITRNEIGELLDE